MPFLKNIDKPVDRISGVTDSRTIRVSRTVEMPGGQFARVYVNRSTGTATWNTSHWDWIKKSSVSGKIIDGKFVPNNSRDAMIIAKNFVRQRKPTRKNGHYYNSKGESVLA